MAQVGVGRGSSRTVEHFERVDTCTLGKGRWGSFGSFHVGTQEEREEKNNLQTIFVLGSPVINLASVFLTRSAVSRTVGL